MHHRSFRWLAATLLVMMPLFFLFFSPSRADDRPQSQQTTLSRPGQPVHVAIVGAIHRPGVYRFETSSIDFLAPTLADVLRESGSLADSATGAIRIIRDRRSGMQFFCSPPRPANSPASFSTVFSTTPLLDNDVVVVEAQSTSATTLTHVVCVDLLDRPVVLPRRSTGETLRSILVDLRQSPELTKLVQVIEPGPRQPAASATRAATFPRSQDDDEAPNPPVIDKRLGDGTVILFDASLVDARGIPQLPPAIVVRASAQGANSDPTAAIATPEREPTGWKSDRGHAAESVINPSEPAPFPESLADESVVPAPLADDGSAMDVTRVEQLPAPSGPQFGPPPPHADVFQAPRNFSQASPPDVPPRALAQRGSPAPPARRRLTQDYDKMLEIPDARVPLHRETTTASRDALDRKPKRDDVFAAGAGDNESPDLESTSSMLVWILVGSAIAVLLIGRVVWIIKPRLHARPTSPSKTTTPTAVAFPNKPSGRSEMTPSSENFLTAILENTVPVVHEPLALANPLVLSGRLDIDRLWRADPPQPLRAPVTQPREFVASTVNERAVFSTSEQGVNRQMALRIDDEELIRPQQRARWSDEPRDRAVPNTVPILEPETTDAPTAQIEQQRQKTVTRLKRITQADRRRVRARTAARRLQQHVRDVKARDQLPPKREEHAAPERTSHHAARPHTSDRAGSVQEGRLDRALAHLQRERTR